MTLIKDPVHFGSVKNGKFIPDNAEFFKADFENFEGRCVEVSVKECKRTDELNAYYWAGVVKVFTDFFNKEKCFGRVINPLFTHELLATKFLGTIKQTLPGGEVIELRRPSRNLPHGEFRDYVNYCKEWGESYFNLVFPEKIKEK